MSFVKNTEEYDIRPTKIFLISFAILVVVNLLVLFICKYPGNITPDSLAQISQIYTGVYYNDNPFYHTILVQFFYKIGLFLFNSSNAAIATYVVFQVIFMAFSFSYALMTMYEFGVSKKVLIITFLFYLLMPYHIMFSVTVWKDVIFGGCVLVFVTAFLRYIYNRGSQLKSVIGIILSGFGICLFRSNGFFAFVIATVAFGFLYKARNKVILLIMCVTVVCSLFMKHTVLDSMQVIQPDFAETFNIPEQQIARVLVDDGELTEEQIQLLDAVVDRDLVIEEYDWKISNPIKLLLREKGNQQYIADHPAEYIRAYIGIGINNPIPYIKAWIDGTKGYWNGGYDYWRWADCVFENEYNLERIKKSSTINQIFNEYLWVYENIPLLQIFLSIGVFVWLTIFSLFLGILRKMER